MKHNVDSNKLYWDKFYKHKLNVIPSQFCVMVATEAPRDSAIVEFGCGNGRDSLYFGTQNFCVSALDLSREAVQSCQGNATKLDLTHTKFQQGDLSHGDAIASAVKQGRNLLSSSKITGYSRFVMHSISDEQEAAFLSAASEAFKPGELFYLEFRSKEDANLEKVFGGHYRRFIDTNAFIDSLTKEYGFKLNYSLTGRGMAKYKDEDPVVSRVVVEKLA